MKIAFSTLGDPRLDYLDFAANAIDMGFDGIEIRGIANELYAPRAKAFDSDHIAKSLSALGTRLEIPMLSTNAVMAVAEHTDAAMEEIKDYLVLAAKLKSKFLRVMCTNSAEPAGGDYALAVNNYKKAIQLAKGSGVKILIETNGMFVNTQLLKQFIIEVGEGAGVLWDIHHPYRYGGESIAQTVGNIGKYIEYVHIKDSVIEDGKTKYKMLSHGDLPLQQAINALKSIGYSGYISLEWVKRWNPDLEDSGIVFAHFISTIKEYL